MRALVLLKLRISPRPMRLGFHFRELDVARRIVAAESLGDRKIEEGAKCLKPIARRARFHPVKHVPYEFRRQRRYTLVAVVGAETLQNATAQELRSHRILTEC
jgi:hypothetical protein